MATCRNFVPGYEHLRSNYGRNQFDIWLVKGVYLRRDGDVARKYPLCIVEHRTPANEKNGKKWASALEHLETYLREIGSMLQHSQNDLSPLPPPAYGAVSVGIYVRFYVWSYTREVCLPMQGDDKVYNIKYERYAVQESLDFIKMKHRHGHDHDALGSD